MNKHELFDLIGEANDAYVNAADAPAKRARPHWRTWAACAACAALIVGAYPAYRALAPTPLHDYTVVEGPGGGSYKTEQAEIKAPHQGGAENAPGDDVPPIPEPTDPPRGSGPDAGQSLDGAQYQPGDAPVDQAPYDQYNALFENAHLDQYPAWYGGAYIDHAASGEPTRLVVCIVEGFRTPELENQIAEWCGEGVWTYRDVKYSRGYLQELMERLNGADFLAAAEKDPALSGWGVYEAENCVRMDCKDTPSDATLAALAELDPDGDAIQVRVIAGQSINTDIVKGPADTPAATPAPGGAQDGQPLETPPDGTETAASARYDTQPAQLPQAKYDLLPQGGAQPDSAEDPAAVEPEGQQPAHYDLLPLDE